jgi:hypothetical protein
MIRRIARGFVALCALLLGAGYASPSTLTTPEDWRGTWHGVYICNQGETGLALTITPADAETVTAIFSFSAIPQNPTVPSGEYTMTGRLERAGYLALSARAWTQRPDGYVMVGLTGRYDPATGDYHGRVLGPGCTGFRLRRDLVS